MKKRYKTGLIFVFLTVLITSIIGVLAFPVDDFPQAKIDPRGSPSFVDNRSINDFKLESQGEILFAAANSEGITFLYPIEGFYYITDYLELLVETSNVANCQYSFDGSEFEPMEYSNDTFHYHYLYDLEDNMNSTEPYEIDFKCLEGETEYNASTYFWINTSELDKYLLRYDIGDWIYVLSDISWSGNENGLLEIYRALYNKTDELYNRISVFVFNNSSSIQEFIDSEIFGVFDNVSVTSINGYNIYSFDDEFGDKYLVWTSGKYLISSDLFFFENITSVDQNLSSDLIDAYLEKYPSDLRYGICGDGEINILNLDGFTEECDGNIESEPCGSDIGECSIGEVVRECSNDCTWGLWRQCTAVGPEEEICDGLDNNCDGNIDEQLICVEPIELTINSPKFNVSNERRILLDLETSEIVDEIVYTYLDSRGREREVGLCRNCDSYDRQRSFSEGWNNLTFKAVMDDEVMDEENVSFFIDSKDPRISKTEPRRGFSDGNFYVEFREDHPENLTLYYGNSIRSEELDLDSCNENRGKMECALWVNLSDFDNHEIEYWFELMDVAGNKDESRKQPIDVDMTDPVINNPDSFWELGTGRYSSYIYFDINITEINFDEVILTYDYRGRTIEKRLCSRLRDGSCVTKFRTRDDYSNLKLIVRDDAGNEIEKDILI